MNSPPFFSTNSENKVLLCVENILSLRMILANILDIPAGS
jgi:hypothetical protein